MLEFAKKYFDSGLSVVPTDSKKKAIGKWKISQTQLVPPNGNFKDAPFMAVIGGAVSSPIGLGLECIDIDLKYDLTGSLFNDYKKMISDNAPDLLKKLVVQQTQSGGYHFIYRCKKWDGNLKLANRPTTDEELRQDPNLKVKVLIETRGEGGYFVVAPSPNYKLVYGDFLEIHEITEDEREILFNCAKSFNTYFEPVYEKNYVKHDTFEVGLSPFDDYNKRGDVPKLLENCGWKFIKETNGNMMFLRPSGTGIWSAGWSEERRIFYVFTTSSEFESNKGYNAVNTLAKLKFNGDYSVCGKWLYKEGYGDRHKKNSQQNEQIETSHNILDCIATNEDTDDFIHRARKGTLEMGKELGVPTLDRHFRLKKGHFNIINGHDNVGKSTFLWYLAVLSAINHNWNWIIYASENSVGGVKRHLMEFYLCKEIQTMTDDEFSQSKKWVEEHFTLVKQDEIFNYEDMINIATELLKEKHYDGFLIDPYNGLSMPNSMNRHEWDYAVTGHFRLFTKKTGCSIYLNCHASTDSLRKLYPKDHPDFAGHQMPPQKADTEGGGKFASRADDFITLHRLPQHESEWMWLEIHVRKIRETETGGKHTYMDKPVKLRMVKGGVGYEDSNGYNPVTKEQSGYVSTSARDSTAISSQTNKFTEPIKETWDDPNLPF